MWSLIALLVYLVLGMLVFFGLMIYQYRGAKQHFLTGRPWYVKLQLLILMMTLWPLMLIALNDSDTGD